VQTLGLEKSIPPNDKDCTGDHGTGEAEMGRRIVQIKRRVIRRHRYVPQRNYWKIINDPEMEDRL
jgi:hypothetical protein